MMTNRFFSNDYIISLLDLAENKDESEFVTTDIDWEEVKKEIDKIDCHYITWKQFTNEVYKSILKNS